MEDEGSVNTEQSAVQSTDQNAVVSDYAKTYKEDYSPEDFDQMMGTDLAGDERFGGEPKTPEAGEQKPTEEPKGEKEEKADEEAKSFDGKASLKGDEKPPPLKELKDIPQSFLGNFFKKNDEGITFDSKKAMSFTSPEGAQREFKYPDGRRQFAPEKAPSMDENLSDREKYIQRRVNQDLETKKIRDQKLEPLDKFAEYYKAMKLYEEIPASTVDKLNQAFDLARNDIQKSIDEELAKNKYGEEFDKEQEKKQLEIDADIEKKVQTNELAVINELKHILGCDIEKAYEEYARLFDWFSPHLTMMFEMKHSDMLTGRTQKEYQQAFMNWWKKDVASNPQNLNWVMGLARMCSDYAMKPYLSGSMFQGLKKNSGDEQTTPSGMPPSPSQTTPPATTDNDQYAKTMFGMSESEVYKQ